MADQLMADQPEPAKRQAQPWPRPAASVAVFRGPEVLLAKRGKAPVKGIWSLPGGHIEPGETAADAALRELDEETGIKARLLGVVGIHDVILHNGKGILTAHYVIAVHAAVWQAGEPVAATDIVDARFVPVTDLASFDLTEGATSMIDRARQTFSLLG